MQTFPSIWSVIQFQSVKTWRIFTFWITPCANRTLHINTTLIFSKLSIIDWTLKKKITNNFTNYLKSSKMQSFLPAAAIILAFATLANGASSSNTEVSFARLPTTYYLQFILANSLEMGETCSWSDESVRQSGLRQMRKFPRKSMPYWQAFDALVSSTVQKGRTYCNATEMLVCDKEMEKCVCGEHASQVHRFY